MRFEAKHSFFKRAVRHTGCFTNILLSLANKHQLMIANHLHKSNAVQQSLLVSKTTEVSLDVLTDDIQDALKCRFPGVTRVHIANSVNCSGTTYAVGMVVCHGSTAGLPDFGEVLQIMIIHNKPLFVIRLKISWYNEHLRSYELENTSNKKVTEQKDLPDFYPLAAYRLAGKHLITLKNHICLPY